MSTSISPTSLLASDPYSSLTNASSQNASTTAAGTVSTGSITTASPDASSSSSSANPLVQDLASLFQALASGNVSAAQSDITKIKADLGTQESSVKPNSSSSVGTGHAIRHHNSASSSSDSNTSSAAESTFGSTSTAQSTSPLDALLTQISNSLSSGSTGGALLDLASFLVQNGAGSGNLINTIV